MEPAPALLRTTIFSDLSPADLVELLPHVRQVDFVRGESVWSEGDPAAALYMVVEGQLKAYRVGRDGSRAEPFSPKPKPLVGIRRDRAP